MAERTQGEIEKQYPYPREFTLQQDIFCEVDSTFSFAYAGAQFDNPRIRYPGSTPRITFIADRKIDIIRDSFSGSREPDPKVGISYFNLPARIGNGFTIDGRYRLEYLGAGNLTRTALLELRSREEQVEIHFITGFDAAFKSLQEKFRSKD